MRFRATCFTNFRLGREDVGAPIGGEPQTFCSAVSMFPLSCGGIQEDPSRCSRDQTHCPRLFSHLRAAITVRPALEARPWKMVRTCSSPPSNVRSSLCLRL